jgi:putative endonuclease
MSMAAKARGAYGERRAAEWYRAAGFEVVAQNWRCRVGEIDLIVRRGGLVAVVEVKARASAAYGVPAEAVTPAKALRLRRLAAEWLRSSGEHAEELRFDVVSVLGTEISVIEAAF